jgi:hypothetical protein
MLINENDFALELPISANFKFDRIEADVRRAGLKYFKPILGKDLMSILEASYEGDTLTDDEADLMVFIKPSIAHIAMWMFVPKSNIHHGNNGVQSNHSGDSKPAFEWMVDGYERSLLNNGFDAMDELIGYLEEVAVSDFPDWLNSEGCTLVRENVINSAIVFTTLVPKMKGSRYLFMYVRPIMARIEKMIIPAITGPELYLEIKSQINSDSLSANNLLLIENIQSAVAHHSWADAMIELNFSIDGEGVFLLNNSFSGTVKGKQPAEVERISTIYKHHRQISSEQLKILRDYLIANVTDYPLFEESDAYVDESITITTEIKTDSGIVSFL